MLLISAILNPADLTNDPVLLPGIQYVLILILISFALRTSYIKHQSEYDGWASAIIIVSNSWIIASNWLTGFDVDSLLGLFIIIYVSYYLISSIQLVNYYAIAITIAISLAVILADSMAVNALLFIPSIYFYILTGMVSMRKILKDQQTLRKERDRAEQAVRSRNKFMTNMSHELRTPLNGIIGMASLLEKSDLKPNHKEMVDTIQMSGDLLLSLINDILDYSKLEAAGASIKVKPNDIENCAAQCAELVLPLALKKNIALYIDIHPLVPRNLVFDSTKVAQILVNLLNNAMKFTDSGHVLLAISTQALGKENDGINLLCRVVDTGVGIPDTQKDAIFEEFSQGDLSATRRFGGTGLGLTICRRLLAAMGGSIEVESAVGVGSTFTAIIPMLTEDTNEVRSSDAILSGASAALLSSNPVQTKILLNHLEYWKVETIVKDSYQALLESLATDKKLNKQPDFIVCDLALSNDEFQSFESQFVSLYDDVTPQLLVRSLREGDDSQFDSISVPFNPLKLSTLQQAMACALGLHQEINLQQENVEKTEKQGKHTTSILVVEDNEVNQKVASAILESLGYYADQANNGLEALAKVQASNYDLVLMDIQMPKMDGLTATQEIRKLAIKQPYIVAMTANAFTEDRERCEAAGMNNFVSKPIRLDDISELLVSFNNLH